MQYTNTAVRPTEDPDAARDWTEDALTVPDEWPPATARDEHTGRLARLVGWVRSGGWPLAGAAAAAMMMLVLGLLVISAIRPFSSADENAHAHYGLLLATEGRLPTLFDRVTPMMPLMHDGLQHVANHPPLFYLFTGPLLALGRYAGHPIVGYEVARLFSILASVGTVALTAGLAHVLFRGRRPQITIGAAALAATFPFFVLISGLLHNDALAVFFSAAATLCSAVVLLRGPSARRVVLLALVCLAGVATRSSNATLLLVGGAAALLAVLIRTPPSERWRRGLVRGIGAGLFVGMVSVVGIGWFYVRSLALYGEINGYGVLAEAARKFPRERFWLLKHPEFIPNQLGLTDRTPGLSLRELLSLGAAALILVGLVFAAGRLAMRWWPRSGAAPLDGEQRVRRAALVAFAALMLAHTAATVYGIMRHLDMGGGIHARYLFPLLAVGAVTAAAALSALPLGRLGLPLIAVITVEFAICVERIGAYSWSWISRQAVGPTFDGMRDGMVKLGVPHATYVLTLLLSVGLAAVLVVAVSIVKTRSPRRNPVVRSGDTSVPAEAIGALPRQRSFSEVPEPVAG